MTRLPSSFVRDRELILVEAEVVGPTGRTIVGMNFLRHFNFEVRQADRQILLELVDGAHGAGPDRANGHPKR